MGRDIHLGSDGHGIGSADRRELLAHELAHAAQQGARPVPLVGTTPRQSGGRPRGTFGTSNSTGRCSPCAGVEAALGSSPAIRVAGLAQEPNSRSERSARHQREPNRCPAASSRSTSGNTMERLPDSPRPERTDRSTFTPDARALLIRMRSTSFRSCAPSDTTTKAELDWTGTTEANRNSRRAPAHKKVCSPDSTSIRSTAASLPEPARAILVVSPAYDAPPTPAWNHGRQRERERVITPCRAHRHAGVRWLHKIPVLSRLRRAAQEPFTEQFCGGSRPTTTRECVQDQERVSGLPECTRGFNV